MFRCVHFIRLALLLTGCWALYDSALHDSALHADDLPSPEDISAMLVPVIEQHKVPAMAVAVIVDGQIVATGAAGVRQSGKPVQVTLNDKWHLGSCTKAFTSTLAAILVQDGLIDWDTTVGEVLTPRRVEIHADYQLVTLEQLLSNTGGCPKDIPEQQWQALWNARGTPQAQRLLLARSILNAPPAYMPGQGYEYSNAGVSVAGIMLEVVAKKPYETLITERIFKPLKMTSAGFRAPAHRGKLDQPYGHHPQPVEPEPAGDNPRAIAPAGAIHCSITDWARFAQLHLGVGDPQLLSESQLEILHTPHSKSENYALGWFVLDRPWAEGVALNHNGSNTMWYSMIWLAPSKKFGMVVTTNIGTDAAFPACDEVATWGLRKYGPLRE